MHNGRIARDEPSSYLGYLPAIYQQDPFIGKFLRIFEHILTPIQEAVNTLPERFDPRLTCQPMLNLLAGWVGASPLERPADERSREIIRQTVLLHRLRGTKGGLRLALELATGERPLITEYGPGLSIGGDTGLGVNTALQQAPGAHIEVVFGCPPDRVDTVLARDIIGRYKPAHVTFSISFSPVAVG